MKDMERRLRKIERVAGPGPIVDVWLIADDGSVTTVAGEPVPADEVQAPLPPGSCRVYVRVVDAVNGRPAYARF